MQHQRSLAISRSWTRALREHDAAVRSMVEAARGIPEDRWHVPSAPGKWTVAEEVLHVVLSYEVALGGVETGAGMRPRVSPGRALLLRSLVLPVILRSTWFPRAKAPAEIRPPVGDALAGVDLGRPALIERLEDRARKVGERLPAAPDALRFHHAYFGDLAPRQAMGMLAAHSRHHARRLARWSSDLAG